MQVQGATYYTISSVVLLQQYKNNELFIDESVRLNLLLDIPHSQLSSLFSLLVTIKNNYLFSLPASVLINPAIMKEILPACYLLASLDHFSATGSVTIPVLRLWDNPVQPDGMDTGIIKDYFFAQGIENIYLPFFEYKQQTGTQQAASCTFYICPANTDNIIEQIPASLTIVAFTPEIKDPAVFNHCISQVKIILKDDYLSSGYIEQKVFDEEMQHWQERTLLYRHFIQLSKSVQEKEYYEIMDWYHKEYEILPLWYKRFGHIIKVIMGKRSFRSLFSDNAKKYKD
jgi:hypothetical protein